MNHIKSFKPMLLPRFAHVTATLISIVWGGLFTGCASPTQMMDNLTEFRAFERRTDTPAVNEPQPSFKQQAAAIT